MSRFLSEKYSALKPYVPGEQPRDKRYIKLNTNESPFPPSPKAQQYAAMAAKNIQLYSDPAWFYLRKQEPYTRKDRVKVLTSHRQNDNYDFFFSFRFPFPISTFIFSSDDRSASGYVTVAV